MELNLAPNAQAKLDRSAADTGRRRDGEKRVSLKTHPTHPHIRAARSRAARPKGAQNVERGW